MIKLLEADLFLKVRKEDLQLIKSLLPECEKEFSEIMTANTADGFTTQLHLLEGEYLTVEEGGECGGVVLYTKDRRIVCSNTL